MSGRKEPKKRLCMVCCFAFVYDRKKETAQTRRCFRKFCVELECCLAEKHFGRTQLIKVRGTGDLNLDYEDVSVCPDCQRRIRSAMEEKTKAAEVELRVRKLQVDLLADLEELKGYMDRFGKKMKGIEEVVTGSDGPCLTEYIEKNVKRERRGDIIRFRESILQAVEDLRRYRQEITDKTECDELIERMEKERMQKRLEKLVNQGTQTNLEVTVARVKNVGHCEHSVRVSCEDAGLQKAKKLKRKSEVKVEPVVVIEDCEEDAGHYFDDGGGVEEEEIVNEATSQEGTGNGEEVEDEEGVRRSKRPRRSVASEMTSIQGSISKPTAGVKFLEDTSDKDDDGERETLKSLLGSDSEESLSEAESNYSDKDPDLAEERRRQERRKEKEKKRMKQQRTHSVLEKVTEMSEFRRKIIKRVLERLENEQSEENQGENSNNDNKEGEVYGDDDPRRKFPVKYNIETGLFTVGDIEMIVNDREQTITCSSCNFIATSSKSTLANWAVEYRMQDHICGKHLDAYICTMCDSNHKYSNIRTYNAHIFGHKNADQCVCDICGKPFSNAESIKTHKWLHMNEDERADAVQRGMTDPRELKEKTRNKPRVHQCSTCGKGFRSIPDLQNHEKIHTEDRERVICHRCGKALLPGSSMEYHEKYGCPLNENQERHKCNVCSKTFKSKALLRRHVILMHQITVKTFICEECGKAFKTQSHLRHHVKQTHSDLRPYACSKSCGATFKRKENANRHSRTCNRTGERARRGSRQEMKVNKSREKNESDSEMDSNSSMDEVEKKAEVDGSPAYQSAIPPPPQQTHQFPIVDFSHVTAMNSNQNQRQFFDGFFFPNLSATSTSGSNSSSIGLPPGYGQPNN